MNKRGLETMYLPGPTMKPVFVSHYNQLAFIPHNHKGFSDPFLTQPSGHKEVAESEFLLILR